MSPEVKPYAALISLNAFALALRASQPGGPFDSLRAARHAFDSRTRSRRRKSFSQAGVVNVPRRVKANGQRSLVRRREAAERSGDTQRS